MIKYFTICGERCSGTNYIEELIAHNFDIAYTWKHGHKHFFGHTDYKGNEDTIFIGVIRNPYDWFNSLYEEPHHMRHRPRDITNFLQSEVESLHDHNKKEIMEDRNMYTKERFKNLFELRHIKMNYLMKDLKNKVKNYIFVKYEDVKQHYPYFLEKLETHFGLKRRLSNFENITYYKKNKDKKFTQKRKTHISPETIFNNPLFIQNLEKEVGYIK